MYSVPKFLGSIDTTLRWTFWPMDPSSPCCPWEMEAPRCSPVRRQVTNCPLPWLYPLPKHLQRKSQLGSSMSSGKNTKNYEVQVHILNQEVVANHGGPPCGVKMLPWPTKKLFWVEIIAGPIWLLVANLWLNRTKQPTMSPWELPEIPWSRAAAECGSEASWEDNRQHSRLPKIHE